MLPQLLLNVKATNNQADWQKESKTSPHHHHHHHHYYSTSRIYCMAFLTASGISTIVANASHSDTSIYFVCLHLVLFQQCCRHFELSFSPSPLSLLSPTSLYLLSLSLDLFCLIFRNTLYPCLFTDPSLLVPHLSSQRSLQSRQCTFSVTASPFPLTHLPPLSPSLFIEHG